MKKWSPFVTAMLIVLSAILLSFFIKGGSPLKDSLLPIKRVGLVEINGVISSSKEIVAWIDELENDKNVPVILVRINSPGGGVVPSYEIYKKLLEAKEKGKKIVISMGSLAASGGYMIACAGDVIMANPGSITGSIGVILQTPDFSGLMDKIGVRMNTIKSAKYKDIGSPYRPMKTDEKEILKGVIMDAYDQFVQIVSKSRYMSVDSVRKIADGRIFTGRQALEIGLVDTIGTMEDAINLAASIGGLKTPPAIRKKPKKKVTIFDLLNNQVSELLIPFRLMYMAEIQQQ